MASLATFAGYTISLVVIQWLNRLNGKGRGGSQTCSAFFDKAQVAVLRMCRAA
jgi:hypothetical protein